MTNFSLDIQFSQCAPVQVGGRWYNPFQRNSFSARIEFPDGYVVVIALPPNAAAKGTDYYLDRLIANAALMHAAGVSAGFMVPEGANPGSFENLVARVPR